MFFLKAAVTATGAAPAGISMDLRFAQSIALLWKTYLAAVVGKISRYSHNLKSFLKCSYKTTPSIFFFSLYFQDFMRQAGEVTYADAHKERTNEGVIEFRSYSDMKRALDKLDGTDINGRKIRLVEDKPRRGRSDSGSRSR